MQIETKNDIEDKVDVEVRKKGTRGDRVREAVKNVLAEFVR